MLRSLTGQAPDTSRINIYRFVLDIDVPESPALVAADVSAGSVRIGSQPKPLAISVLRGFGRDTGVSFGVALDAAPYFLAGGGSRTLDSYRDMSFKGRLTRVLTKTIISLGLIRLTRHAARPLVRRVRPLLMIACRGPCLEVACVGFASLAQTT
jgi:hypothetical protein